MMSVKTLYRVVEYKLGDRGQWIPIRTVKDKISIEKALELRDKLLEKREQEDLNLLKETGQKAVLTCFIVKNTKVEENIKDETLG